MFFVSNKNELILDVGGIEKNQVKYMADKRGVTYGKQEQSQVVESTRITEEIQSRRLS